MTCGQCRRRRPRPQSLIRKGEAVKQALVNGQLTPATSDAPAMATCPGCGGQVKLRNRQGTYFWRHVELPREGCRPANPEPVMGGTAEAG
jgi:hypothetical protein